MIAASLIKTQNIKANFDQEISRFSFEDHIESEGGEGKKKLKIDNTYFAPMNLTSNEFRFGDKYWSATFDEKNIFIHQEGKGIKKLVKTWGQVMKVGYVEQENTNLFSSEKCKILYLKGKLYVRSSNSDLKPFKLVNPETLNEIEGDELTAFNEKLEQIKRKEDDDRNKNILEWSKESYDEEKDWTGRYLCSSPLITDG